jgi:hypothetical protein
VSPLLSHLHGCALGHIVGVEVVAVLRVACAHHQLEPLAGRRGLQVPAAVARDVRVVTRGVVDVRECVEARGCRRASVWRVGVWRVPGEAVGGWGWTGGKQR